MNNLLILRTLTSPFNDQTKNAVLSQADVDNNFIYLKGKVIDSADSNTTGITLTRINGEVLDVPIPGFSGFSPQYQQTIEVSADFPDNYVGSGTPTISAYSVTTIYQVTFSATNTTSATTISIDGLGSVPLVVPTENGLEGPVPSGITSGITYFMVYDGGQMQLFDNSPENPSPILYTNLAPVPTTIGGVTAGMTFSGATMQQMWDTLLYPYATPTFSNFYIAGQSTTLEIGATINGGSRLFVWSTSNTGNIKPNSIKIKNLNTNTIISTPTSGMTNDGSETIVIPSVISNVYAAQTWAIYATTNKNVTISRNFSVIWYNRIYWGTSTATTLTASGITGLTNTALSTTSLGTRSYASGGYKYFCIPTALNNPASFRDASTSLTVAMAGPTDGYTILNNGFYVNQVVVTNAFGVNVTYDVYRTKNILGGAIDIVTS